MHSIAEPFPFDLSTADATLLAGGALLYGWALLETTGAAGATVDIMDGTVTASSVLLAPISLTQGESTRDLFAAPIMIRTGLQLGNVAGAIRGALFATPVWRLDDEMLELFGQRV